MGWREPDTSTSLCLCSVCSTELWRSLVDWTIAWHETFLKYVISFLPSQIGKALSMLTA